MLLNIVLSLIYYSSFSYIAKNIFNYSQKNINSINIMINSSLIVSSCSLFLTNSIKANIHYNILLCSVGFYINDLILNYINFYNKKILFLKTLHHLISFIGILSFYKYQFIVSKLFQTVISNIPLEIRNIYKNTKI